MFTSTWLEVQLHFRVSPKLRTKVGVDFRGSLQLDFRGSLKLAEVVIFFFQIKWEVNPHNLKECRRTFFSQIAILSWLMK